MEGIQFVREDHLSIADGCYLPRADLLGHVQARLHEFVFQNPELKQYIPNLLEVDVFISWDGDKFLLFISTEKRAHLPVRGMETKHLPLQRENGRDVFKEMHGFVDLSNSELVRTTFADLGFTEGFASAGIFPAESYSEEAKTEKAKAGAEIAKLIQSWAHRRKQAMESTRIFLSHKGINKPLVEKIDQSLRLLNLKTWFDSDDLSAGDTLIRGIDAAFSKCSAAVFFISAEYIDAGVIKKEIDRALHEATMRSEAFKIIPLVLRQHGGSDSKVPEPFRTLVWKTVDDVEIVPTILKALPGVVQGMIRYSPLK